MKKVITITLALVMMFCLCLPASAAIIGENPDGATIELVAAGDGVEFNRGTIIRNDGSVGTNYGVVKENYGVIAFQRSNTTVINKGTVRNLFSGTVDNVGGHVETLFMGTVNNYGGSIGDNYGGTVNEFRKVSVTISNAEVIGLTEAYGDNWIPAGGSFIIKPEDGFKFENGLDLASGNADITDNGDGTYTVSGVDGDITITAEAVEIPAPPVTPTEPDNSDNNDEPTLASLIADLVFSSIRLVITLVEMMLSK